MKQAIQIGERYTMLLLAIALLVGLYLSSLYSFLLFHSIAEGFSAVVGFSIFLFAWNSRHFLKTDYFLFLGIAYLSVAALDLMHTFAYKGMGVFPDHDARLATNLWLEARLVQSVSLLVSPLFLRRRIRAGLVMAAYAIVTGLFIAFAFSESFPATIIEGEGLTTFKMISEYAIMMILLGAAWVHFRHRQAFDPGIFNLLIASILLTVVSELMFTIYVNVYDAFNLLGHFLKIVAFYLIYRAVLQTGLERPFNLLFHDLERAQERYRAYFNNSLNGLALFQVEGDGSRAEDYVFADGNAALTHMTGIDVGVYKGKPLSDLPPVLDREALLTLFQVVRRQGRPQRTEQCSPLRRQYLGVSVFLPGPYQVAMVVEDITERKQTETVLQESEQRLQTVLENMPVLLFATDEAGHIIAWNRECERVTGYSEAEVTANHNALESLIADPDSRRRFTDGSAREPYRGWETELACKDGTTRCIAWSSVASEFPVPGWADWVVGIDITERKTIETLEREQRRLAEALRDVANALNSALSLSEVLDRLLGNLERVIPHDMAEILLVEPQTGEARVVGSRSADAQIQAELADLSLKIDTTRHLHTMMVTRQPLIVDDIQTETHFRLSHDPYWRAYLGAPIQYEGQVIGFIGLGSWQPDFFTETHADRLEAFAGQAAIAIHNAHVLERERALVATQERERLARDLHDAVSQTLFSASMIAEALPRQWQRSPEKALAQLAELHYLTRGAMAEMRVLLLELRPTSLLEVELPTLLRQLAEAIRSRKRMAISVDVEGEFNLQPDIKLALYRITQEALNNIAKHAEASQASIRLVSDASGITLTIEDNGAGFDPDHVQATSLGLEIMRERSEEIGATLTIESHQGSGTRLRVFRPAAPP